MKPIIKRLLFIPIFYIGFVTNPCYAQSSTTSIVKNEMKDTETQPYRNHSLSVKQRIDDLISRMTLEEKIGQMNMPCIYIDSFGLDTKSKFEACRKFAIGKKIFGVGPGGGFFDVPNEILHEGPKQQADFHNYLQKMVIDSTRLKIPLLMIEEGTHGLMCSGATIFPEGLGLGSTWNMNMIKDIYAVAAKEARAIGVHQLFTLVIEPNRDPRLGRNQEGYSEDPYLCSRIAESIVAGTQGDDISAPDKVVAGLCHYPGQGEGLNGIDHGPMDISERKLREVFLPPWVAGIKNSGALAVMAAYPAIDGIPVHASEKILTNILREELGFKGVTFSEGGGLLTLIEEHVASSPREAGAIALKSGVDVGISYEDMYMAAMIENVHEGNVDISLIDRAVRRIIELKLRLGLFEEPYVDPANAVSVSHTKESQLLALQAAREGIVLLKNKNNMLPLNKDIASVAVIGPNADNERNLLGDYISNVIKQDIVTVLEGIKGKVSANTKITYTKGCNVTGNDVNEIDKAVKAAKRADLAIVVVGENERHSADDMGTNGEGRDVTSLDLTGLQEELVKAVYKTGTPTIVILVNGRPLSTRWISENIPAVVEAFLPGEQGGLAIADVLFGDYNPSGRLPITIPRSVGQLPMYYNFGQWKPERCKYRGYVDLPWTPLYEFGFGLSYTSFEYSNLLITPVEGDPKGIFHVCLDVKNTGDIPGEEVVQLYINDFISSVSRPVKELKGFEKVKLNKGEKKNVKFLITAEHLSFINKNLKNVAEPGIFKVMVGSSSEDIRLNGEIELKSLIEIR